MKLVGIGLLFSVILWIGWDISAGWKGRLHSVECLRTCLLYIGEQIESFSAPLEEIYEKIGQEMDELREFSIILSQFGWSDALAVLPELPEEAEKILLAFGQEIGRGSQEQELARCRHTVSRLERLAEEMRSELPKRIKLCRSLALTAGMAAVIVLL